LKANSHKNQSIL